MEPLFKVRFNMLPYPQGVQGVQLNAHIVNEGQWPPLLRGFTGHAELCEKCVEAGISIPNFSDGPDPNVEYELTAEQIRRLGFQFP
jgi:hypothetical protein